MALLCSVKFIQLRGTELPAARAVFSHASSFLASSESESLRKVPCPMQPLSLVLCATQQIWPSLTVLYTSKGYLIISFTSYVNSVNGKLCCFYNYILYIGTG